ncbi:ABC transporter substrate-binding protein [Actinocorallia populi]|uniref:ABC transporter substrate-binding protein n=1 Tax=Actinocorallia populi TaxID=2079200 RepID=UPI0018E58ECA|nr:ABC transporter substrate-binding protein [Actinocorallia populi]
MLRRLLVLPAVAAVLAASACAPADNTDTEAAPSASAANCAKDKLPVKTAGKLTIATDTPAFEPWFKGDDPGNGEGFEGAVAYAVAERLGFAEDEVVWTKVGFEQSYAPGDKDFDFDINQISITPERQKAVTFSDGYYTVAQGVVTLGDGKFAGATTKEQLKDAKIGVQVGTTSLTAVQEQLRPATQPSVFNTQIDVVNALKNGQVDAVVVDLPTAFYVTAAQIEGSKIVGQLAASGEDEQFGLLLEKGNPLVTCLNQAIGELKSGGKLQQITDQWLSDAAGAPVLK